MRVLFVCTANICRSPSMELMARALVGDGTDLAFASAGTHGFVDHEMDATMAAAVFKSSSISFGILIDFVANFDK